MSVIDRPSVIANTAGPQLITGWKEYGLDRKGRLVLPREWTGLVGRPFMLIPCRDGRLHGMNARLWERALTGRGSHPLYHDSLLSGSALVGILDWATGRFLIPHTLREHAGLRPGTLVRLIGKGDCFEIISRERWLMERGEVRG